jgi:transcriptional regulator with XRE-family HTH domain
VLSVEDWAEIRRLRRSEQLSISEIARVLGISRNTVMSFPSIRGGFLFVAGWPGVIIA